EAEAGTAAGYDAALLRAGDSPAESVSRPMPASVASAEVKEAASPENGAAENPPAGEAKQDRPLEIGDCVYISYLGRTGIVYEAADARGNVGVMIQRQKVKINHKRLSLYIEGKELYPEDYDMDIVFESKENRKKRKLMERKHVEGLSIVHEAEK
ncbi:DNA mismatch repair protein MutS, partial [Bacillus cereus]|nr:DNA mismatch repair protein MutS [Bacillus cereus]